MVVNDVILFVYYPGTYLYIVAWFSMPEGRYVDQGSVPRQIYFLSERGVTKLRGAPSDEKANMGEKSKRPFHMESSNRGRDFDKQLRPYWDLYAGCANNKP